MISFLEWLEGTAASRALLESLYLWPLIESTHVLSLGLFVGTAIMLDLRLLNVTFRGIPASEFTGRLLPWTRFGFAITVVTGVLLFYSSPIRYYHNLFFRIKLIALVIAGLNVWFFHSRTHKRIAHWDLASLTPRGARVAAVVSLLAWATVVVTGRMIAYNWFDCDIQPQSSFVNWASGCVLPDQ